VRRLQTPERRRPPEAAAHADVMEQIAYDILAYLAENPQAPLEEAEARELVAANLCRCTGYQGIIEAVLATARARRER